MAKRDRRQTGFSIIEVMVALVAGLIVSGAVLAFTLSSLRSNAEYVQSTRLTQELRTNLDFISRELRRAGYDENALGYLAQTVVPAVPSPFSTMQILNPDTTDGCVVYAYDRLPGTPGQIDLDNGEIRAIRRAVRTVAGRSVGVLEFAESAAGVTPACNGASPNYNVYPPACNAGSGWCALSDPRSLDIGEFRVTDDGIVTVGGGGATAPVQIRQIGIALRGSLAGATDVVRGAQTRVRVRADCVRNDPANSCTQAPAP